MNIVILGAGKIGSYLASSLSQEHHNVVVIDKDIRSLDELSRYADVAVRQGSGTNWHVLEEIKQFHPHFFIALSSNDETNLLACAIAKRLGYPKTVARIRDSSFLERKVDMSSLFAIDHIIGTELVIAQEIFTHIVNPGSLGVQNFAEGKIQMRTIIVRDDFAEKGVPLSQASFKEEVLIGLICRKNAEGKVEIIFPRGNDVLMVGDEITLFAKTENIEQLFSLFRIPKTSIDSVVVIGGSGVAMHLSKLLLQHKVHVKIIEQDEQKCLQLAKQFPSAVILNHTGIDLLFLKEERVSNADFLVACTSSSETNVLVAALGKQAGCNEVIALVSDEGMAPLLHRFHISYTFSEKASIANRLHVILNDDTFISYASHYENQAKIMEIRISQNSPLLGISLSRLSDVLPNNLLLGLIQTKDEINIPKGHHTLAPGDIVLVICAPEIVRRVKKLF